MVQVSSLFQCIWSSLVGSNLAPRPGPGTVCSWVCPVWARQNYVTGKSLCNSFYLSSVWNVIFVNSLLDFWQLYSVHLVESVENCGLSMRRYLACSSYANVMHRELAITRALRYDVSARDYIMRNRSLPSLPLSCTGFNFYWLDEVNRSISVKMQINHVNMLNLSKL